MPRSPRFILPHSLQHVVDQTFQSRALLRPSDATNQRFLGVLAKAQKEHEMTICAVAVMSTHYHLLLQPDDAQHMAKFMCFLKTNLAKEIGTRLLGWRGNFFAGRFHNTTVSDEETAQVQVLRYILAQGVKENLVDRVGQWPGVHCADSLLSGRPLFGKWFDRTSEHKNRAIRGQGDPDAHASIETLGLSPLPCWQNLESHQYRQAVGDLVTAIDRDAKAERTSRGKSSLGVPKILAANPLEMPGTSVLLEMPGTPVPGAERASSEKSPRSPQPRFHAATKVHLDKMIEVWRRVIEIYREAPEQLRSGELGVKFPEGTFPPALAFVEFSEETLASRGQPV